MGVKDFFKIIPATLYRSAALLPTDRIALDLYHFIFAHYAIQSRNYLNSNSFKMLEDKTMPDLEEIVQMTARAVEYGMSRIPIMPGNLIICIDHNPSEPTRNVAYSAVPEGLAPAGYERTMTNPCKNRIYPKETDWAKFIENNPTVGHSHSTHFMYAFPLRGHLRSRVIDAINFNGRVVFSTAQFFANSDGEALVAYLNRVGYVNYGMTGDSDFFLYGGRAMLRPEDRLRKSLHLDDIMAHLGCNFEQFERICLILGTDYNNRTTGYGPVKAVKAGIDTVVPIPQNILDIFRRISTLQIIPHN